eukprot:ANDGO_02791.mRNA.1 hypothetical protein
MMAAKYTLLDYYEQKCQALGIAPHPSIVDGVYVKVQSSSSTSSSSSSSSLSSGMVYCRRSTDTPTAEVDPSLLRTFIHIRNVPESRPIQKMDLDALFASVLDNASSVSPVISAVSFVKSGLSDELLATVAAFLLSFTTKAPSVCGCLAHVGIDDNSFALVSSFCAVLESCCKTVPSFSLRMNALEEKHIADIFSSLKKFPVNAVRTLDLYGNDLQAAGCVAALQSAELYASKLQVLNLGLNRVVMTSALSKAISNCFEPKMVPAGQFAAFRKNRLVVLLNLDPSNTKAIDSLVQRIDDSRAGKKLKKGEELSETELAVAEYETQVKPSADGASMVIPPFLKLQKLDFSSNFLHSDQLPDSLRSAPVQTAGSRSAA